MSFQFLKNWCEQWYQNWLLYHLAEGLSYTHCPGMSWWTTYLHGEASKHKKNKLHSYFGGWLDKFTMAKFRISWWSLFESNFSREKLAITMGVSKKRGTPKWMVKIMENPIKMRLFGGFYTPYSWFNTPIYNLYLLGWSRRCPVNPSAPQSSIRCTRLLRCRCRPPEVGAVRGWPGGSSA